MSKIIYVDMDGVLADYNTAWHEDRVTCPALEYPQSIPGFYYKLKPIPCAIVSYHFLTSLEGYRVHILSSPSSLNPYSYTDKANWILHYLGQEALDNAILSRYKDLNKGDYLIDDNIEGRGQDKFEGKLLHFGEDHTWKTIRQYFRDKVDYDRVVQETEEHLKTQPKLIGDVRENPIVKLPADDEICETEAFSAENLKGMEDSELTKDLKNDFKDRVL